MVLKTTNNNEKNDHLNSTTTPLITRIKLIFKKLVTLPATNNKLTAALATTVTNNRQKP
jgi:hypothetical protein